MCFLPNPLAEIPPNDRAKKLARLLYGVVGVELLVITLAFISALYTTGVVNLIACLVILCALRKETYNIQCVMCFTLLSGFSMVLGTTYFITFLVVQWSDEATRPPNLDVKTGYQEYTSFLALLVGLLVYAIATYIGKQLYDQLREIFGTLDIQAMMQPNGGLGGPFGQQQQQAPMGGGMYGNQAMAQPAAAPQANAQPSFKAFSGPGYSLA